ncbi:hypothetical protein A3H26_04075 [candidate division WWE3 bacterium RIFCSPLOWO2_12_FULL_36_10]|uniref:Uncharacterized protein n=1 Tax=candidate division WWE3 bacterium RIFCSPLOWO2_12_FULL_36_10 TaxID=1802630 RepID=A0A1F4VJ50_UNCKA|nr:MAG: hypothetical protein A3H26_04075 [candidate division WWE3 bacterium RIFCSPLOWO2_12_FULL_36_10]
MTNEIKEAHHDLEFAVPTSSDEKDKDNLRFVMLSEMGEKEKEEFRQKVERSKGTIQVWIHIHYMEHTEINDPNKESLLEYRYLRDRVISSSTEAMPIVSFIETPPGFEDEVEQNRLVYSKLTQGLIYVVPTFQGTSVPCIVDRDDTWAKYHKTEVDNWDVVGGIFAELGVKKIIIRGRNLDFREVESENFTLAQDIYSQIERLDTTSAISIPDQCLGNAIVQLKARGFEILPSRVTFPKRINRII